MKTFYTYVLIDSSTNKIFYVGKGSGDRMYKHVQISKGNSICRNRNKKLYNKIQKIISDGNSIISLKVFENENESLVLEYEIKLISELGVDNLCNLTLGGEGTSYPYGLTESHKKNISKGKIGKKRKPITDETRKKLSESRLNYLNNKGHSGYWKDKTIPEEVKEKMSISHKNIVFSSKHKENLSKALKDKEKIFIDIEKLRSLFNLGYSQRKIANILNCNPRTIKNRLIKHNIL